METIKKWIPNLVTLGNFTCGMLACWFAAKYETFVTEDMTSFDKLITLSPSFLIFTAAIFDFLDGFVARLLKVSSELGKQLDSLADVVSFGVAPSFILMRYELLGNHIPSFFGLSIAIFACIRLAKFNIDTRQSDSFLGLPVPSTGMVIASLPLIDKSGPLAFMVHPWFVLGLVILLCILMVSELPLLALKFKNYGLKDNWYRYLVLLIGLMSILFFQFQGLPMVILGYVLVSLLVNQLKKREHH
jgi:CDP-diacylglycerol--serine O-phosphatidyltransferase